MANYCNNSIVVVLLLALTANSVTELTTTTLKTTTTAAKTTGTTPKITTTGNVTTRILTTTGGICEDNPTVNCTKLKKYCEDHHYDDLLNKYCRRTCGRCFGTTTAACFDASNECEAWNHRGFCNSSFYPTEMKREYCAKTCELC